MAQFERLTIDDIARLASVSRTTASMVLNGQAERYRISAATVERVLAVAREYHFAPSQSARALRLRRSNTVGLVIPDLTNSTHAALAQAMEWQCRQLHGYQLVVVTSDEDPQRETQGVTHLIAQQVDALIVVPCTSEAKRYEQWAKRLPLVFVDRRIDDCAIPSVVTDAVEVVATLVGDAIAGGVREVAYIGGQPSLSPSRDRLAGYRDALARHGLKEKKGWVAQRNYHRESGYALIKRWYEQRGRCPEALFAGSITLLEGVLRFLNEQARLDQTAVRLMTFDDHQLLDCLPVRIDAIVQNSAELAKLSLANAFATLNGDAPVQSLTVAATIRRRSATEQQAR